MNMVTLLATLATAMTGQPCAVIDNLPNEAAFAVPGQATVTRTYTDYGESLGYNLRVPREAWAAAQQAEGKLQQGEPGHKVAIACTNEETA